MGQRPLGFYPQTLAVVPDEYALQPVGVIPDFPPVARRLVQAAFDAPQRMKPGTVVVRGTYARGRSSPWANATEGSPGGGAKKLAIVAIGRSILVIIWHLLQDPDAHFHDLGADHFNGHTTNPDARKHSHIRELEALGYTVTLTPAA